MKYKLKDIALFTGGEISGNPDIEIIGVSEIQNSYTGAITFLGNIKYKKYIDDTKASAIIVSDKNNLSGKDGIIVMNPQLAIAKVLSMFFPVEYKSKGIHKKSIVDYSSNIGNNVTIEAGAVIEAGAIIGESTFIGSNVFNILMKDYIRTMNAGVVIGLLILLGVFLGCMPGCCCYL